MTTKVKPHMHYAIYTAVCRDEGYEPHAHKTIATHDQFMRQRKQAQWLKNALAKAGYKNGRH